MTELFSLPYRNALGFLFGDVSGGSTSGKDKAHKDKQFFPVTARIKGGGGLPTGWPGVKRLCGMCRTQGT